MACLLSTTYLTDIVHHGILIVYNLLNRYSTAWHPYCLQTEHGFVNVHLTYDNTHTVTLWTVKWLR